jgi:hypothetical protein
VREKWWDEIPDQPFTADGTSEGLIIIADAIDFKVKQKVIVSATGQLDAQLIVKRVLSATTLVVGPAASNMDVFANLLAYTVVAGAKIHADAQTRPPIPEKELIRAAFAEEPANAFRTMAVDQLGNALGNKDNPLQVETDIQGVSIFTKPYDSFDANLTGSTTDIYSSYVGGYPPSASLTPVGTLVEVATINYTDSTKNNIKNVYRTPFI